MHIKRIPLFLRIPSQRISIRACILRSLSLSPIYVYGQYTPYPPPQLYAHAYNHRSERIRTCLLSYNYTLLPSKSITSFLSTYITPERDNNPYETLTSQRILSLLTLNIYAANKKT